ncbi:NUDIX domain-containing protein [uncultured Streptomyces sp.]|uniref:NUDIX domain-containing protein n=1 Tax=uncultured Streptomyces sp. TaxID=174707 RepID=UPI00262FCF0A|nr:NUDIX hydrolase [uncultured Streptomyces sp.]
MTQQINLVAPPACRIGGLAWIPNEHGEILTVRANYGSKAGYHQLPGGHAGDNEPNLAAMINHTRRETGITPVPVRLLGIDWVPGNPDEAQPAAMGQNFVYQCSAVHSTADLRLPPAPDGGELELSGYAWVGPDTARTCMRPYQHRRFLGMWNAWKNGTTAVLQDGRPVLGGSRGVEL